jgi:hypothetical protein
VDSFVSELRHIRCGTPTASPENSGLVRRAILQWSSEAICQIRRAHRGLRVSHCDPLIHRGERLVPRDGLPKVPASLAHRIHDLIRVVRPFFTANMQVLGIVRLALLAAVHPTHVTGITTNGT